MSECLVLDKTLNNPFFPTINYVHNNFVSNITEDNDGESLRAKAKLISEVPIAKQFLQQCEQKFSSTAGHGKTIDEYFSELSSYLSKAKTNLKKLFNFIRDNAPAFNIPDDVVAKINNILGNATVTDLGSDYAEWL